MYDIERLQADETGVIVTDVKKNSLKNGQIDFSHPNSFSVTKINTLNLLLTDVKQTLKKIKYRFQKNKNNTSIQSKYFVL